MTSVTQLLVLSATLWGIALLFIVFAWLALYRQQTILRFIARRLATIERSIRTLQNPAAPIAPPSRKSSPETKITIDKNEPLSKYETVNLPDEIDINFVDR